MSVEAVRGAWADVGCWGEWNADIERVSIDGTFAVGAQIEMRPRGADPVVLRVAEARARESFVDEADIGGAVVTTTHLVEPTGEGRVRILYRTEITGPEADEIEPQLGPAIADDFPKTIAAPAEFAT